MKKLRLIEGEQPPKSVGIWIRVSTEDQARGESPEHHEKRAMAYAEAKGFPIIPCDLCGSQEQLQRKQVKAMLDDWERQFPGRADNIFNSLTRVTPSHLLDRTLFDFANLVRGESAPETVSVKTVRVLK